MSNFWRAQVSVSDVVRTPASLDISNPGTPPPAKLEITTRGPEYVFQALDWIPGTALFSLFIEITVTCVVRFNSSFAYEWGVTETHTWRNFNNSLSNTFATYFTAQDTNGAAFLGSATLKIERDDANLKYIITGLLGSEDLLFADTPTNGIGTDFLAYKLEAASGSVDGTTGVLFGDVHTLYSTHFEVAFSNFYTYKNDLTHPYRGASLAAGQRGHWLGGTAPYTPWTLAGGSFTSGVTATNPDTASRIVAGIITGAVLTDINDLDEYRIWDAAFFFPVAGKTLDLIHAREHGAHWLAAVDPANTARLLWQRTHDYAHSWATGTIYSGGGDKDSPSINWTFGKLVATWYDGSSILQAFSFDLGATWGAPMSLSLSGSNPCHLVDPASGFSWYFYFDSDKLKLKRSGNFGAQFIEGTPITVIDPMDQQTVTAQLALDGSLIVVYIDGGSIKQIRSFDLGLSWSAA